jgi:hypothetical protein
MFPNAAGTDLRTFNGAPFGKLKTGPKCVPLTTAKTGQTLILAAARN